MTTCFSIVRVWSLVLVLGYFPGRAGAQNFQLITATNPGQGAASGGGGDSWAPIISPDGRFVLFASAANNLIKASNNAAIPAIFPAVLNVYLRDRQNNTTELVSVNLTGVAGGNGDSIPADLSTNGRYAVFASSASDLVLGDTNNATDVFVRDLVNGTTTLVSAGTNGIAGNGPSRSPAMTPDGRYVAFVSEANDLVPGDSNQIADVFVRDLQAGTTVLASVGAASTNTAYPTFNGSSDAPSITPDGRFVAFFSTATNLVQGAPPGGDVYLRDLAGGVTTWVSSYARTALNTNNAISFNPSLSADGQFVAYEASGGASAVGTILRYSMATGLTDVVHTNGAVLTAAYEDIQSLEMTPDGRFIAFIANTNAAPTTCVLLWDANSGTASLVSGDTNGQVPLGSTCDWPSITPDGRFVTFLSSASNLTSNLVSGDYHLYVRDTRSGTMTMLDADNNGVGSLTSPGAIPRITPDGHFAAFDCGDGSLVANDRNRASDAFVRDLTSGAVQMISTHDPTLPSASPNGLSSIASTSMSADGRYVVFVSDADNLTPNDTNGCQDVFVRDLAAGTTVLVSANTNGFSADAISSAPVISPDGRFVAFTSSADDLVAGDTNNARDVFVRDLQTGITTLASVNSTGTGPGSKDSYSPIMSAGGRYVVFRSVATNLAPVYSSSMENLFVRDIQAGVTYALTTQGQSGVAVMTPDGHYIGLGEYALNTSYFYLWNSQAASFVYTNTLGGLFINGVAITPDGCRSAIAAYPGYGGNAGLYMLNMAANTSRLLAPGATNYSDLHFSGNGLWLACSQKRYAGGTNQVYLYDLQNGGATLVSHSFDGVAGPNAASDSPAISADGRFIAYRSGASNLVPGDTNGMPDIFVYDRQTGANSLLSGDQFGGFSANNRSLSPVFSGDGDTLVFESWASDLVSNDFNQTSDLFAYTFLNLTLVPALTSAQGSWLTWPWVSGKNYRVEFKDDLGAASWQELGGSSTNQGNKAWLQDPAPAAGQRFYRVGTY